VLLSTYVQMRAGPSCSVEPYRDNQIIYQRNNEMKETRSRH